MIPETSWRHGSKEKAGYSVPRDVRKIVTKVASVVGGGGDVSKSVHPSVVLLFFGLLEANYAMLRDTEI